MSKIDSNTREQDFAKQLQTQYSAWTSAESGCCVLLQGKARKTAAEASGHVVSVAWT